MEKPRVVREFKISKSLLGQKYSVSFVCPHCSKPLKSAEEEIGKNDLCPTCNGAFRVSRSAKEAIDKDKQPKINELDEKVPQTEQQRQDLEVNATQNDDETRTCSVCGDVETSSLVMHVRDGVAYCKEHLFVYERRSADEEQKQSTESLERWQSASKKNTILTTGNSVEGFRIVEYLGIDGVELIFGTGLLSESLTEVVDVFGGRSKMFESKLRDGRQQALQMLKILAVERGANAIIGIDFDYSQFSSNRTAIIVTGTFVRIIPTGPPQDLA